nr:protein translocase subunit SecD [Motilibacter aurantiacus]
MLVLLVILVAIFGGIFIKGDYTPRLGLDLQGGTSVVLLPRTENGAAPTGEQLDQAVDIIRQRVDARGVTESEIQTQGDNIVVSVPGATGAETVRLIASTAKLTFRPVLAVTGAAPIVEPTPTPSGEASAPAAESSAPAARPAPTASSNGRVVPDALRAAEPTPAATATAPATEPLPTEAPTVPDPAAAVPAEVQQEFQDKDCTAAENRGGGTEFPADATVVACDRDGAAKYLLGAVLVQGENVDDATAGLTPNTANDWLVQLDFDGEGTRQFSDATQSLVAKAAPENAFAIVLDNAVISAPTVQSAITDGNAQITGDFSETEARDLANVLRYGALPLAFEQGEINTISATVGEDQLDKGILAGAIGLVLVLVYSLLFYRGLGLVSVASLVIAGLLTWGAIVLLGSLIGFTLILAGVVGVIVSIGITADSFVVFFERLRDEIREGRTIRTSVEHAWKRARRTILVADGVTILCSATLYFLAIGRVQNFAFTLGLSTLIDLVVVFLFTKPLVSLLVRTKFFGNGHRLSGLNPESVGRHISPAAAPVATATRVRTAKEA